MAGNFASQPASPSFFAASCALQVLATSKRWIAIAAIPCLLGACTVVRVRDADGVRVSYYPGVAVVQVRAADAMQVVEVEALGLAAVGNHFSLGWLHSQTALIPPGRCHLIMLRADAAAVAALGERLGRRTALCTEEGEQ